MFAKNYHLHWIAGRVNILSKYIIYIYIYIYIYISILGVAFAVRFLYYFQKLQLLVVYNFWTNFCCIVLLYHWAQKLCLRFLKSYFKLEILNIFVLRCVYFSRYVQLRSSISDEKSISGEIETHFRREAIEN